MSSNVNNNHSRKVTIDTQNNPYCDNSIRTSKYTVYNFIPLFLFYFYSNYFNLYFLVVTIILSIKEISTMSWTIGVIPYLAVILMSVIREAFEDYKKYSNDKKMNEAITQKYNSKTKKFEEIKWGNILTGDILKIKKNEEISSDLLIIHSSSEDGLCYLETSNLDGENALKPRKTMTLINLENYNSFDIYLGQPDKNIYELNGFVVEKNQNLNNNEQKHFFNKDNVLLRGASLKNVDYIYGIVLYSGKDTKLMQNIERDSFKRSHIEKTENAIVIYVMLFTFLLCIVGAIAAIYKHKWLRNHNAFYLFKHDEKKKDVREGFKYFGIYFLIFQNITPICLMIALEVVKMAQVFLMSFDENLFKNKGDKFKVLNFRIQEDLGNIKYVFTDKTGTLTKNEMKFRGCSIMNILYNESNEDNKDINNSNKISYFDNKFNKKCLIKGFENLEPIKSGTNYINTISDSLKYFFLNISLNHNVLTEKKDNNEIVYQGSNPDELTLVNCANELDIKFQSCIGNKIKLIFFKQNLEFEILERFEFSSERKRSSIVVEDPISKKIFLYMKGADDVILTEKCLNIFSYEHYFLKTKEHIDNFARAGYRTLCYCMREIDKNEFNNFHNEYKELKTKLISNPNSESLKNEIEKLIGTLEINMVLLGASCLEDKLQNGVKKTISNLIDAGISVWMLTGDKIDTAESIAYSCKLFNDDTNVFRIPKEENEKLLKDKLDEISNAMEEINKNLLKKLNDMRVKKDINENMKFNPNDLKNENEMKNEEKKKEKKLTENIIDINSNKELLNIKRINVTNVNNVKKENNNENKNYNKINSDLESNKDNNINNNNKKSKRLEIQNYNFIDDQNYIQTNLPKNKRKLSDSQVINFLITSNYLITNEKSEKKIKKIRINDNNNNNNINFDVNLNNNKDNSSNNNQNIIINNEENSLGQNSINSVINEVILTQNQNNINNKNNDTHEINFKTETPIDDYRNKIQNKIDRINTFGERAQGIRFKKKKSIDEQTMEINNDNKKIVQKEIIKHTVNYGLIIEDISITKVLDDDSLRPLFLQIISNCRSVVLSRCSPIQKSKMVATIKNDVEKEGFGVLAIGDGGNDVNMIKEANVGIGIFGKEGYQAAYNSDYAISNFSYLTRLLFYHGRFFMLRNSYFIYYFFYKSIIYAMPHFWFLFFNGYSSSIIYDDAQFLIYNALGSNLVIGICSVLEQDIDLDFNNFPNKENIKELLPDIYKSYRDSHPFTILRFIIWSLFALCHTAVIFFVPNLCMRNNILGDNGYTGDYWTYAMFCYMLIITYQTCLIFTDFWYLSYTILIVYIVHILVNFLTVFIRHFAGFDQCAGHTFEWWREPKFWLIFFMAFGLGYIPYYIYFKFKEFFVYDIVRELKNGKYIYDIDKKKYKKQLKGINKLKKLVEIFKNYYENDEEVSDKDKAHNVMYKEMKELVKKYKETELSNQINKNNNENNIDNNQDNEQKEFIKKITKAIVMEYPEIFENYNNINNNILNNDIEKEEEEEEEDEESNNIDFLD